MPCHSMRSYLKEQRERKEQQDNTPIVHTKPTTHATLPQNMQADPPQGTVNVKQNMKSPTGKKTRT